MSKRKKIMSLVAAGLITISSINITKVSAQEGDNLSLKHLSSYSTGSSSDDGGAAEIVKFNSDNNCLYVVNGVKQYVNVAKINDDGTTTPQNPIDLKGMMPEGFTFGDVTSIDINTDKQIIAIAVQEKDYSKNGKVFILDYNGNVLRHVEVGVQPDMVKFTTDSKYILTADEGEPRNGYGEGVDDPKGSVSIIDISGNVQDATSKIVTFDKFDSKREELINNKVVFKTGAMPSEDFEPEYIALSKDSKTAYVSLQEANSIATLDIESGEFTSVKGLGFKDFSVAGNEIDAIKDGKIEIKNQNIYGVYMPDGIASYEVNGKTYLLTANEGDSREYVTDDMPHIDSSNEFNNIKKFKIDGKSVEGLDTEKHDGLDSDKNYVLGGRSFSIWDADTMTLVYDSGSDFEKITAEQYPEYFNSSNKNTELDNRSAKKGPEPEDVQVGTIDGKMYAFVGVERIGGLMMYDITNPQDSSFVDYINTRDFSGDMAGDCGAEGIQFISSEKSPTGKPMVLVANEISGTVALYGVNKKETNPGTGGGTVTPTVEFKDIADNHWAKGAIERFASKGYLDGYEDNTFRPDNSITRAEFVKVVNKLYNFSDKADIKFTDVNSNEWYYEQISIGVKAGYIDGYGDNTFKPNENITREEACKIIAKVMDVKGDGKLDFKDSQAISDWAKEYVDALFDAGIIDGYGDNTFRPKNNTTRAESVTMLDRIK